MEAIARQSLYGFEVKDFDNRRVDGKRKNDIKQLWQRSHEIINLALSGFKNTEIAEMLDITPQTVSNTLNSELGVKKLAEKRFERDCEYINVSKEVARLAKKAIEVYEEIFDNPSADYKMKKETADTVLMDLGGHRAPTKIDSRHLSTTVTLDELEAFKRRGLAAARETGMLVDVKKIGPTDGNKVE